MPSMETSFASVVRHERITLPPALITLGVAVMVAVGAGPLLVIGGGGGGGAAFLLHPATTNRAAMPAARVSELRYKKLRESICTVSSLGVMFLGRSRAICDSTKAE